MKIPKKVLDELRGIKCKEPMDYHENLGVRFTGDNVIFWIIDNPNLNFEISYSRAEGLSLEETKKTLIDIQEIIKIAEQARKILIKHGLYKEV